MHVGTIGFHAADKISAIADQSNGHVWIKLTTGKGADIALHFDSVSYAKASLIALAINEAMSTEEPTAAPVAQAAE